MLSYQSLSKAVQSEKDVVKYLESLSEEDYRRLMVASQTYCRVLNGQYDTKKLNTQSQNATTSDQVQLKHEEEETKRFVLKKEEELIRLANSGQQALRLEQIKTEQEKKLIDYRLQKETESLKDKVKLKLEAEKQFHNFNLELIEREKVLQELAYKEQRSLQEQKYQLKKERIETELRKRAQQEEDLEKKLADHKLNIAVKEHEAKKDWLIMRDMKLHQLEKDEALKAERVKWESLTDFFSGDDGRRRMYNIAGLVASTIGAYFVFKAGYPILQRSLQNYFFKPKLITKQVRYPFWKTLIPFKKKAPETRVFFVPQLQSRLESIIESTRNTSRRGGVFSNLLFYGIPGTGKTLFSEKLAHDSGIDFAVMSGPSFDQFKPHEAIVEIKNLFNWANQSKRGLLLFVDEADSFLEDRSTIHPKRVSVLNEWINQTGTESRKFMCVYETNRPENLDPAVQSRITQSLNFEPPTKQELQKMLEYYGEKYIINDNGKEGWFSFFSAKKKIDAQELVSEYEMIAEKISAHNFVGRDVTNLIISLSQAAYAEPDFRLSKELIWKVVQQQINKKYKENEFLIQRNERISALRKRLAS